MQSISLVDPLETASKRHLEEVKSTKVDKPQVMQYLTSFYLLGSASTAQLNGVTLQDARNHCPRQRLQSCVRKFCR